MGVEVVDLVHIPDAVPDGQIGAAVERGSVESPDDDAVFNGQLARSVSRDERGCVAVAAAVLKTSSDGDIA